MNRLLVLASQTVLVLTLLGSPGLSQTLSDSGSPGQEPVSAAGANAQIALEGDTTVAGTLTVQGLVATEVGVRFPDSTIQTTASPSGTATANQGLYSNWIAAFAPPFAYSEVCFGDGAVRFDVHSSGESTDGGNCLPGDTGFVIERVERNTGLLVTWLEAKAACLADGMRLLEPFEWQFACDNAAMLEVERMTLDQWEWVSNSAVPTMLEYFDIYALGFGNSSCSSLRGGRIAAVNENLLPDQYEIRCGR